jgi:hypothetical protein
MILQVHHNVPHSNVNATAPTSPTSVVRPAPIFIATAPFPPEPLLPLAPAPVAVAVPLPLLPLLPLLPPLPLDVPFEEEFPDETAGRPCTLILLQAADLDWSAFPGVYGRNEIEPVEVSWTRALMDAAYVLDDLSVGPERGSVELLWKGTMSDREQEEWEWADLDVDNVGSAAVIWDESELFLNLCPK